VNENSYYSTFSSAFDVTSGLDFDHFNRWVVAISLIAYDMENIFMII
jgi:hypothetical protein